MGKLNFVCFCSFGGVGKALLTSVYSRQHSPFPQTKLAWQSALTNLLALCLCCLPVETVPTAKQSTPAARRRVRHPTGTRQAACWEHSKDLPPVGSGLLWKPRMSLSLRVSSPTQTPGWSCDNQGVHVLAGRNRTDPVLGRDI